MSSGWTESADKIIIGLFASACWAEPNRQKKQYWAGHSTGSEGTNYKLTIKRAQNKMLIVMHRLTVSWDRQRLNDTFWAAVSVARYRSKPPQVIKRKKSMKVAGLFAKQDGNQYRISRLVIASYPKEKRCSQSSRNSLKAENIFLESYTKTRYLRQTSNYARKLTCNRHCTPHIKYLFNR